MSVRRLASRNTLEQPDLSLPQGATLANGQIAVLPSRIAGAGYGLFACTSFARGAFITRYSGHTASTEYARRQPPAALSHVASIDGVAIFGPSADSLAPTQGAGALANHQSHALCNARLHRHHRAHGRPEYGVWLVATRDIAAGEEITVHYGQQYWLRAASA